MYLLKTLPVLAIVAIIKADEYITFDGALNQCAKRGTTNLPIKSRVNWRDITLATSDWVNLKSGKINCSNKTVFNSAAKEKPKPITAKKNGTSLNSFKSNNFNILDVIPFLGLTDMVVSL